MYRPKAKKYPDIKIYGPGGIKKTTNLLFKAYYLEKHKYLSKIKIKEIHDKSIIRGNGWKVKSFKVKHVKNMNCLAYRIEADNKKVCYSGDSSYCAGLKNTCKNVDLAIIEVSVPENWKIKEHINGKEVGKLANETRIKKLILTHVDYFYLPKVKKDVGEYYKGKVILAKDLMKVRI